MGQTAWILGALNFRLPRRVNFRSPVQLNLKPLCFGENLKLALTIKFKSSLFRAWLCAAKFKIYRASSIRRVNLDYCLCHLNFKNRKAMSTNWEAGRYIDSSADYDINLVKGHGMNPSMDYYDIRLGADRDINSDRHRAINFKISNANLKRI